MKSPSPVVSPAPPDVDPSEPSGGPRLWWIGAALVCLLLGLGAVLLWRLQSSSPSSVSPGSAGSPGSPGSSTAPGSSSQPGAQTPEAGTLLDSRAGFGRNTRGGDGGAVVHVTTAADDGPGSLRAAVSGTDARWIVFDGDYTINSSHGIAVGSNKTIDGRGHRVTLTAPNQDGLVLDGSHNVIIENMVLRDFGDITRTSSNNPYDAIRLDRGASDIWIDHSDLSMAGDKLIAVDGGSHDITVSWSHFHDQEQVFQIGNQTNKVVDAGQTVTIHHNFFDHTGYRNPVVSYGRAHVYDNLVSGWKTYGMRSERNAQLYSESNIFEAAANRAATKVEPGGSGCNDKKTLCDSSPGFLKSVGDLALNGAKITTSQPENVFDPHQSYPYRADRADDSLKQTVTAQAGWRPR